MAKHPHYELIKEWIEDTSRDVECREAEDDAWYVNERPDFDPDMEWRFKPEPKPDIVKILGVFPSSVTSHIHIMSDMDPNLKLTFDGKTGKLKSAEVLE